MGTSSGILSLIVKGPFPEVGRNNFHMARERIPIRQRLARNLRILAAKAELSGTEIGKKAGIDQKTVTEMMKASFDPRLSKVEKIANVFGMAAWQLLAYDFEERPPDSGQVVRLLEHYSAAPDAGRQAIMQVAEIASHKAG